MTGAQRRAIETALAALGLPDTVSELLSVEASDERLPSQLAVDEVAVACVGAALLAALALRESRGGGPASASLEAASVRAAVISERHFQIGDRERTAGFAPASRFWPAADGWVRTHANFPWHHEALRRAVKAGEDDELADAISCFGAEEVEERVFAAGGVAAAARSTAEWASHPQGAAVAAEPLIAAERFEGAPARRPAAAAGGSAGGTTTGAAMPASGIRVLDLTRVIAGPVGSRYLASLGAEVLRIDPPALPDLPPGEPFDTLIGKRSAFLDLAAPGGGERLEALLGGADVVLLGYRPGALERFGLAPADLAARHPGLAIVQLAAWGHTGPWSERRGFDSIVQAASGIAAVEAGADGAPGALPCQLLDHGTGYLVAAAALDALRQQEAGGGTQVRRLSLARTAHWLLELGALSANGAPSANGPAAPATAVPETAAPAAADDLAQPTLVTLDSPAGPVRAAPPPGALDGVPLHWPPRVSAYGDDSLEWEA